MWGDLYKINPGYVLGFHGCDRAIGEDVLAGKRHLKASNNDHDWLGPGIYFWECSPARAMQWAVEAKANPHKVTGKVDDPFVVGAVIDLGVCLNLFDTDGLEELKSAYQVMAVTSLLTGEPLPKNRGRDDDKALRDLDCAALLMAHRLRKRKRLRAYDSVRAAFPEGGELYPGAGLTEKNHIQLAVKKSCIKGYFRPILASMK